MNESDLRPGPSERLLALDTGSPRVTLALALAGTVVAERSFAQARSSAELLRSIDDCLREAGLRPADLTALVVLRGPGSFTGLRIGLATVHGLRAALGTAVAVLPTLHVLAAHAVERQGAAAAANRSPRRWIGAVDALRGEWYAQAFGSAGAATALTALAEAAIVPAAGLAAETPAVVCGFGVTALAERAGWPAPGPRVGAGAVEVVEAGGVAATAARLAPALAECWDAALLTVPLYLREPAVTLPTPR